MTLELLFDNASRVMTVVSFITFAGIWIWAWSARKQNDFAQAARLPFTEQESGMDKSEEKHDV